MKKFDIIASTTFGLEALTKRELLDLGYDEFLVENGRITIKGEMVDVVKLNLWLRTAERISIKVGEFKALTFTELFDKTKELPWEEWIDIDGNFMISGKSLNSKLFSVSDCQSIVEKAIVERLKENYDVEWFSKSKARFKVEVSINKDIATLTLNTSGDGLHKRGYRNRANLAPIKETLAASLVMLSYWNNERLLYDPFCGSGTILIEALLIGKNIAPGLDRKFDFEEWEVFPKEIVKAERIKARNLINHDSKLRIMGSDIDKKSILIARDNLANLGLEEEITFFVKDMRDVDIKNEYGVLITNPPYGVRMGNDDEVRQLYVDFGNKFRELDKWSIYVITNDEDFERYFGKRADRKRKLYNGRIKVDYYQFFGPKPIKER
ncbi:class I SAM-dependent RNA methyltransferase [Soehngenia longivitae]|uniref:Class I SAM-dependent RNA methyltransferase n=1 Tax=Soehngenia longivitae TaxID=2562294 RepID=A0A4Z0D1N0_9FIRM|nr:class I SAM-dependent RNA methyltransferase [Soehngenia longivitae]TFZ39660.1 class I SAM-dependent RNA methyltransferase [Soehngenia longivitae]